MPSVRRTNRKVKAPAKKSNNDVKFGALMYKAKIAADNAGDKWVAEHTQPVFAVYNADVITGQAYGKCLGTMLDICGFAYVQVTDKRTAFAKWLKTYQKNWNGEGYNNFVHVRGKYDSRQELGLKETCAWAAYKVFTDAGIKGLEVYSRID